MKHFVRLVILSASAFAQAGFETLIPPEPLGDTLRIDADFVSVQGHWVATGDSKLAGPSVYLVRPQGTFLRGRTRQHHSDGELVHPVRRSPTESRLSLPHVSLHNIVWTSSLGHHRDWLDTRR